MAESFQLLYEGWIPVRMKNGGYRELGIEETLTRSHEISEIVDQTPVATVSIHRLLLAIVYRIFDVKDEDAWQKLWRRGLFDPGPINKYLGKWAARFDLFHPKRPFYQDGSISDDEIDASILKLYFFAPGSSRQLIHSLWEAPPAYDAKDVARMVVSFQYYARCGKYDKPSYEAPLNDRVTTIALGDSLFETLLLNLPGRNFIGDLFGETPNDRPAWESDDPIRAEKRKPAGYLDFMTRQVRRIRVLPERGGKIRRVSIKVGSEIEPALALKYETMTPFRIYKENTLSKIQWNEDTLAWRDLHAYLRAFDGEKVKHRPSRISEWAARLVEQKRIDPHKAIRIGAFGTKGDKGRFDFWRQELVPLRAAYFGDEDLMEKVREAVRFIDAAFSAMNGAVKKGTACALAYGLSGVAAERRVSVKKTTEILRTAIRGFASVLEHPFLDLLEYAIDVPKDELMRGWKKTVGIAARSWMDEVLESLSGDVRMAKVAASVRHYFEIFLRKEERDGAVGQGAELHEVHQG